MQVHAAMVTAVVWLAKQNDTVMSVFSGLPDDIRTKMPYVVGFILLGFGVFARNVQQREKTDAPK